MTSSVWLRLCLLAVLWGSEFYFVEIALRTTGTWELVTLRLALASSFLVTIVLISRERLPRHGSFYAHCAVLGCLATLAPYFLMAWAQERVSSALTGILVGTGPLMTAALAAVLLPHEHISRQRLFGIIVGLCGIVFVIDPFRSSFAGDLSGSIAALGVALGFAIGYVYNARYLASHEASGPAIMAVQSLFGLAFAVTGTTIVGDIRIEGDFDTVASILVLGLFCTGLAAAVFFSLLRSAGAVVTSLVEYLMVIVAVALGVTLLDEHITWITAGGVALVIGGIAITERAGNPKNPSNVRSSNE
jgi:drug/metabolite transporter (DMT)-like permease